MTRHDIRYKLLDGETLKSAYRNAKKLAAHGERTNMNEEEAKKFATAIPDEIAHQFIIIITEYAHGQEVDSAQWNLDEWKSAEKI